MNFSKVVEMAMLTAACSVAFADDAIYFSYAADGMPMYSSQPYNAQYRPLFGGAKESVPREERSTVGHTKVERQARLASAITHAAVTYDVEPALIKAIIDVESGFDPTALSAKGAKGAMQLMPGTASRYGAKDAFDSRQNIDAGTRYLKDVLNTHQGNLVLALAAYNAGPGSVRRHNDRIPPYSETMLYVPQVLSRLEAYRRQGSWIEK